MFYWSVPIYTSPFTCLYIKIQNADNLIYWSQGPLIFTLWWSKPDFSGLGPEDHCKFRALHSNAIKFLFYFRALYGINPESKGSKMEKRFGKRVSVHPKVLKLLNNIRDCNSVWKI